MSAVCYPPAVPFRQLNVFTIGCWAALAVAALQVLAHAAGLHPPLSAMPAWITELVSGTTLQLPGGAERTLFDVLDGFSLASAALLATVGGMGLAVRRRATDDPLLLYAVARVMAGGTTVLLALSLMSWGVVPSIFVALPAVCFVLSAVRAPAEPS